MKFVSHIIIYNDFIFEMYSNSPKFIDFFGLEYECIKKCDFFRTVRLLLTVFLVYEKYNIKTELKMCGIFKNPKKCNFK